MRSIRSIYGNLVIALAIVAGAMFAAIALLIPVDVTLRACCNDAIFGLADLTEHGLAAATFLAAPWVLWKNAHVSVDIALMALSGPARRRLDSAVSLLGAAVSAIFFWYATAAMLVALGRGSMVRGILVVPEWLTFASPILCFALLTVGFLLRLGAEEQAKDAAGF